MSKVYWIKGRSANVFQNAVAKVNAILGLPEMAAGIEPEKSIAVKFNLSEMGYSHYVQPVFFSSLFQRLREYGVRALVTDSCSIYKGSRFSGYDFLNSALTLGFSVGETFDSQMMLAAGYTNEEGSFYPSDGKHLGGVEIGSLMTDTNKCVVVSHVTAHPVLGMAGALYNLGLGFLTGSGKLRVHECLNVVYDGQKCDHCAVCVPFCPTGAFSGDKGDVKFDSRVCNSCLGCLYTCPHGAVGIGEDGVPEYQESVVEAAHTAKAHMREAPFFINILSSVTPQSDEYPYSDVPFVPDLGILASDDPAAVDWATYRMIVASPGLPGSIAQDLNVLEKGQDKLKAITGRSPARMIEYAEKMGLGTRDFEMLASA